MCQTETQPGHDGAEVCGRIDRIWRDGSNIMGEGIFDAGEFGLEAARLVTDQVLRGVSVDLAVLEYEIQAAPDSDDEAMDIADGLSVPDDTDELFVVTDGVIGGARRSARSRRSATQPSNPSQVRAAATASRHPRIHFHRRCDHRERRRNGSREAPGRMVLRPSSGWARRRSPSPTTAASTVTQPCGAPATSGIPVGASHRPLTVRLPLLPLGRGRHRDRCR